MTDTTREALERCTRLLKRYVSETPLGHQPHMIALEAQEAIAQADAALAAPSAEPVALTEHELGIIADIEVMSREHGYGFWSRALALGTLNMVRRLRSATPAQPPAAPKQEQPK